MRSDPTPNYVIRDISEIIWYVAMECDRLTPSPTGAKRVDKASHVLSRITRLANSRTVTSTLIGELYDDTRR